MNILPQILSLGGKNLIIDYMITIIKEKLHNITNAIGNDDSKNRYTNMFVSFQNSFNDFFKQYIVTLIEYIDLEFKNSDERKKTYYINKSNVQRTIVTIFGEITFKRTLYINKYTNEYYNYVDDVLGIEAYDTYDPIVKSILVNDSVHTNPNLTSYHSSLDVLNLSNIFSNNIPTIPRQTIYRFKNETKVRKVNYEQLSNNKTLYVMVDEKWVHEQDKNNPHKKKWIMVKCFVTFTNIKSKGKRNKLINKHVFITSSNTPWKDFAKEIYLIYDFEKIETINLLSDAGPWILAGRNEIKFYAHNKITINTCTFHVKQKINRSTTDKELRDEISNIIFESEDKQKFISKMDELIASKTTESRKQKVTEYKNYILRHWKGIINMKYCPCKSSMEAQIEHCIASKFTATPKAYSKTNIDTYLKLQELYLNGINIISYYLDTYNSDDDYVYNSEKEVNFSRFEKSTSILPVKHSSNPISMNLHSIAFPV